TSNKLSGINYLRRAKKFFLSPFLFLRITSPLLTLAPQGVIQMKILIIFSLLSFGLCSCQFMDDQTIISQDREKFGNPTPVSRNFKQINGQHKVLVAIIDTGIDYNHPYLIENLHFKLNQNFIPV